MLSATYRLLPMPRYKLTLEYDGTRFFGWQRQKEHLSVQERLERAVTDFCGETPDIVAAGRTDTGVHASAQVAHMDLQADYEPFRILMAVNAHLRETIPHPADGQETLRHFIVVTEVERVSDDFHARFSAQQRFYTYRILNRRAPDALSAGRVWHVPEPLDADAMREAAKLLLGTHDFTSFRDSQCQAKSPLKTLERFDVERSGNEIRLHLAARSFLHHQVRIMAGSLKMVGSGRWQKQYMLAALEARDRSKAGPTAPAEGLCLTGVEYP